jgi:hypothetical protein
MVVEEDQKRKVTTEAVAGWILRKEEGPLEGDEKPRDDPQSEAFVEEEERHTSVMVNPEDECGTGDDWIEDCPTPEVAVVVGAGGVEKKVEALLDSGSEVNVISRKAAEAFKGNWKTLEQVRERSWSIRTANGSKTRVQWCVELTVRIGNSKRKGVRFYVVEGVPVELVIGNSSMVRCGPGLEEKDGLV